MSDKAALSCRIMKPLLIYFGRLKGEEALREAIRRSGAPPEIDVEYIADQNNWISLEVGQMILDTLSEESGDPDFPHNAGRVTGTREGMGFAYTMARGFGTVRACYAKAVQIASVFNRAGVFKIHELGRSSVTLSYQSDVREPNERFCKYRIGQFESFPTIWGLPPARTRERSCQVRGDATCTYAFEWVNPPSRLLTLGGAVGGGALGAVLVTSTVVDWPMLLTVSSGVVWGGFIGAFIENVQRVRQHRKLSFEEAEEFGRLWKDLQRRFDEIRALNETLELKVEARTTELKKASEELARANSDLKALDQMKNEFFANVSHELRTPLTLILAPIEDLLSRPHDLPYRETLQIVHRNADRLLRLIDDLLDLARLDAGGLRLHVVSIDLADALTKLVESFQPAAKARKIGLDIQVDGGDCPLF
jgi:hypothetical protein